MRKTGIGAKKILLLAAALTVCAVSAGAVVANNLRGFKDVTEGTAVTGTVYEEAAEMVKLSAEVKDDLIVSAEFADYMNPPYIYLEAIDINIYKIVDSSCKVINEGAAKAISEFENGRVVFELPLDDIASGEYKLIVNEFLGSKKADQDLPIKGTWECSFVK